MTEDDARDEIAARVSRETFERLDLYRALLEKWQQTLNLVARTSLAEVWSRHFLDGLQVLDAAATEDGRWLDLGSGGGFPGLVCAVGAQDRDLDVAFELVESDARKCAFLREVARRTETPITIHNTRIEALASRQARVISARALAPLSRLLDLAAPHLAPGGVCLFQKGASHLEELESARARWQMDVEVLPSLTAPDSVVLRIRNLAHAA